VLFFLVGQVVWGPFAVVSRFRVRCLREEGMASLRQKKNSYFVRFRLGKRQFEKDVGQDAARATATKKRVEATLLDIKNGRIKLPDGADIAQFVVSDE
jgi:hypothetical protein